MPRNINSSYSSYMFNLCLCMPSAPVIVVWVEMESGCRRRQWMGGRGRAAVVGVEVENPDDAAEENSGDIEVEPCNCHPSWRAPAGD